MRPTPSFRVLASLGLNTTQHTQTHARTSFPPPPLQSPRLGHGCGDSPLRESQGHGPELGFPSDSRKPAPTAAGPRSHLVKTRAHVGSRLKRSSLEPLGAAPGLGFSPAPPSPPRAPGHPGQRLGRDWQRLCQERREVLRDPAQNQVSPGVICHLAPGACSDFPFQTS